MSEPVPAAPAVTRSWRTTAFGAAGALVALLGLVVMPLLDDDPATVANWAEALPIALTALGLGVARDNAVSSERAGAVRS